MPMKNFQLPEQIIILPELIKWFLIASAVGILSGIGSGILLSSLEWATNWRQAHLWIIAFLPLAGFFSGWVYHQFGKSVEAGNNLLLEEIHNSKNIIPLRMAPFVLLGTDITHLFGGSAGREGTALQIAAALGDQISKIFQLSSSDRRFVLMSALSGGFASVFGTPLAGTIFGLEVLSIGIIRHNALFPCVVAAVVGNRTTLAMGLHHTAYRHAAQIPQITPSSLISAVIAGMFFGIVAMLFAQLTHLVGQQFKTKILYPPLRPAIGGIIIALIVYASGSTTFIGLGIPTILSSFEAPLPPWDFAAKIGFTTLTLGAGFKGGEVTPLFFIGATLGNALSSFLALPTSLLAGMGFVAVFGGAANTPIASTLMGIELFGLDSGIFVGIACVMSYLLSGHSGIYSAQRIGAGKYQFISIKEGVTLASHSLNGLQVFASKSNKEINFSNEFNFWNSLKRLTVPRNSSLTVLRIYLNQILQSESLIDYLILSAQEYGIEEIVFDQVSSGFLKDDPPYIDLVASKDKLQGFIQKYQNELKESQIVMLQYEKLNSLR